MKPSGRRAVVWLPVRFAAAALEGGRPADRFETRIDNGRIELHGLLTAVGRQWRLGATATRRRRTIALNVTAREGADGGRASVHEFRYTAVIEGLAPGPYSLRVFHVYGVGTGGYIGLGVATFGRALVVP